MKPTLVILVGLAFLAGVSAASAACPPGAAGSTPEEIHANGQRLLCLQRELAEEANRRQQQLEIDALNRRLRDLELQRQFDRLPMPQPLL
ncbi:MAG: hypothetical protein ABS75_00280 [Pelagibacterium sp. SCN 63-23]|nr:MAG: hypothetical protein ABS75_00280 [Pelagibacterium sp. SCN 63-23]